MAKTLYVFSTLASDVAYTNHIKGGGDMPIELAPVVIKGGAGVMNDRLVTPRGVMTKISGEDLDYLRQNEVFQLHETNGFVRVEESAADPDAVAADMTGRDNSAPLVPQDGVQGQADSMVVGGDPVDDAPAAGGKRRK